MIAAHIVDLVYRLQLLTSAGFYCPMATVNYTDNPCPSGYYCLADASSGTQNPCPAGTYNNVTEATDDSYCLQCPSGMYCDNQVSNSI